MKDYKEKYASGTLGHGTNCDGKLDEPCFEKTERAGRAKRIDAAAFGNTKIVGDGS